MRTLLLYLLFLQILILSAAQPLISQSSLPEPTLALTIPHDAVFGFYPIVTGSFGISSHLSMSFYGIFWTNPSFANALPTGTDWFLETGAGLSFNPTKNLLLNPSVGLTHGKLLSGGTEGVIAEGLVPNLAAFYNKGKLETELYVAYYKAMRKRGPVTTDYLLAWLYVGAVLHERFSAGIHYEEFGITRLTNKPAQNLYRSLGGYLKITLPDGYSFRFSAGKNFTKNSGYPAEFYRLGLFLPVLK